MCGTGIGGSTLWHTVGIMTNRYRVWKFQRIQCCCDLVKQSDWKLVVPGPAIEVHRKVMALAIDSTININQIRASVHSRVLWLATAIVNHANNVRSNSDGTKVGGHQSSSASSVAILSALFFETMKSDDRIAIKPHASPVFQLPLAGIPQQLLRHRLNLNCS